MITGSWRLFNLFRATLHGNDTPRQIAFGIAMGMLIGLIPKDSLFAWAFGIMLMISTANLFAAFLSTLCFCWVGLLIEPYVDELGYRVLTIASMQPTYVWLFEQPVVPWTKFNNTVVTGSLLTGFALFYPVYRSSWSLLAVYGPRASRRLNQFAIYRWFAGNPAGVESIEESTERPPQPATEAAT